MPWARSVSGQQDGIVAAGAPAARDCLAGRPGLPGFAAFVFDAFVNGAVQIDERTHRRLGLRGRGPEA